MVEGWVRQHNAQLVPSNFILENHLQNIEINIEVTCGEWTVNTFQFQRYIAYFKCTFILIVGLIDFSF